MMTFYISLILIAHRACGKYPKTLSILSLSLLMSELVALSVAAFHV